MLDLVKLAVLDSGASCLCRPSKEHGCSPVMISSCLSLAVPERRILRRDGV